MSTTKVGQRVTIKGKEEEYGEGTVKFVGIVKFDTGKWVGIELDKPMGKHDGVVKGERYFQTKPNHAVFTKYGQTNPAGGASVAPTAAKKTTSTASSSAAAAKKPPAKSTTPKPELGSRPSSNPASSAVSSATNSAAPTPPNELEDVPEDPSESSLETILETPSDSQASTSEIVDRSSGASSPVSMPSTDVSEPTSTTSTPSTPAPIVETPSSLSQQILSPVVESTPTPVSTPKPASVVSPSRIASPPSPLIVTPATPPPQHVATPKTEPIAAAVSTTPKPASTASPSKISTGTPKTSSTPAPKSPSKLTTPKTKAPEPVASSSTDPDEDDSGLSAYELDMKIKELEDRLAKSENANDELKSANARLESQVSILKEGSDAIISQHQAGGAAREAQEAEWRATIRDLKSKLESSSERSMELEKKNRELEHQLASVAKSITEQVTTAVQKATSEVSAEIAKLRIESEDKIETLQTDLEMATVDKEIAEEERDTAVKEMEQLKLQNEMLEAFKQAAEETASKKSQVITSHPAPTSSGEGSGTEFDVTSSEEYISLHSQHERLKEALVKLKNMAVEEKQSHERTSRELEQLNLRTIPALEDKILKLSEQNVDYEEQVEILKANIDDAAELQEKYTDLFERKLDLEEENRKLKNDITEMEALRDLSEQLEEEQAANEARLKAELYEKQVEVLDREAALKNAKDQIASQGVLVDRLQGLLSEQRTATSLLEKKLSNALSKSRKRRGRRVPIDLDENGDVTSGNSEDQDLEDYEDEEVDDEIDDANEDSHGLSHSSSTASLRSLQQKESELQVILQKQAAKAAIQSLASKLGDLERKQAIEQFALYQAFVPENYIRVDSEAIKSLLLSKRLREKSSIVVQYLREQFHLERFERSAVVQEDVASITPLTTTEELAYFAWNLAALITRLGNNAAIFAESFKSADQESYMRFARLHSEMAPMEKKMDHLISLLQQEELTASYSLADFETLLEGFDPLISQHCQLTSLPANQHYMRLGSELVFASRSCFFEVVALKSTVNQTATTSGVSPAPLLSTIDLISQTIVKYLVDGSRKLRRAAESRPALTYVGNTLSQLRAALRLSRTLQGFFRGLRQKVEAAGDRLEEAMLAEMTESMVNIVDPQVEEILQALPSADETTQGRLTKKYDASVTCVLKLLFSLDEDIARGAHDGGIVQIAPSASSSDLSSVSSSSGLVTKSPVPTERVIDGVTISNVLQLQSRASVLLEEVAAAAGLKGELSSLQKELRDRESALGFKSKEIEDLEWRLRKQEHRLQTLEKVEIEAKEELASHQKNYASQVMNLETANRELTEKIEQLTIDCEEAKTSSQAHAARAVSLEEQLATTIQTQQQSISLDSATTQISSLRAAVGQLRSEVSRHRTKEARISLQTKLPSLAIPSISTSITATNTLAESMEGSTLSSRLQQISGHADKLVNSAYTLSTMPCIVDLTRSDVTPGQQLESLQFQEVRIKASLFEACRDTVKILSETEQASAPSHFSSFPTTAFVANVNSTARGPITVGKVTIPTSRKRDTEFASARRRPVPTPVPVTPADLVSIHSLLAQ